MIRSICELCGNDDATPSSLLNFNKILEINQEVKDSLIKFVCCNDYEFAVKYGIIASHRDYLNYDQWLQERTQTVGLPFIKTLIKFIRDNV